jgi:hypothetical protein
LWTILHAEKEAIIEKEKQMMSSSKF